MKLVADGIYMVGRYGLFKCASWLLFHGGEAMVVEAPHYIPLQESLPQDLKGALSALSLDLKYVVCTHRHINHVLGLKDLRREFDRGVFLAHKSFLTRHDRKDIPAFEPNTFDKIFDQDLFEADLGGEPLYIIHAPKHSMTDLLIIFRGTMILGDWWLGPGDLNENDIPARVVKASIDRTLKFLEQRRYGISRLFDVHGDDLRYNVDFEELMKSSYP